VGLVVAQQHFLIQAQLTTLIIQIVATVAVVIAAETVDARRVAQVVAVAATNKA
jgi:hypothetical protein